MEIGVWGDSITYGEGDAESLGWVGRIRKGFSLEEWSPIYNFGICGDTSTDVLKRFAIEAASFESDLILFAVGINDSKIPKGETLNRVVLSDFIQNIERLIEQGKNYAKRIVLIGLTAVHEAVLNPEGSRFSNEQIGIYNDALKEIASRHELQFIDVFSSLIETDLYDGLHPNAQGYQKLAAVIGKVIPLQPSQ